MESIGEWIHRNMKQENKEEIVKTVMEVWGHICPGWELYCISLPIGDPEERKKIMQYAANEVIKSTRE